MANEGHLLQQVLFLALVVDAKYAYPKARCTSEHGLDGKDVFSLNPVAFPSIASGLRGIVEETSRE